MKTYCKPAQVNIERVETNIPAVRRCFEGKLSRSDFKRLLKHTGMITESELAQERLSGDKTKTYKAMDAVAAEMTQRIRDRKLNLRPIRQSQREDGLTHKMRDICQESPEQQVMEYMAVDALMPMFKAKLLPFQNGSIPKRGQLGGKRKIERLLRRKFPGKLSVVKGDVKKAYPSVTVVCVMGLLRRDVGKNKILLWFLEALMANYPGEHLCIGGYLPAWLFNYVMSYVLRYLMEQKYIRRGKSHKLVRAIVCYADDFSIYGYFSELTKAMKKATKWCKSTLGLNIKPVWQIYHVSSYEEEKIVKEKRMKGSRKRTSGVDMMGYVVYRTYTIIRGRVFRRIRRQFLRAARDLEKFGYIPWWRACRLMAYKGWIKYSDSVSFSDRYNIKDLLKIAARSVSIHGRKEYIKYEQRMLLIAATES